MKHSARTIDLKAPANNTRFIYRCLVVSWIVSASFGLQACASTSPNLAGSDSGGTHSGGSDTITLGSTTLGSTGSLSTANETTLLAHIKILEARQIATNKLIEDLQTLVIENQIATEEALAMADAAQQMTAASDDRMEQLFQQSMFK